jgi:hypothetical protein
MRAWAFALFAASCAHQPIDDGLRIEGVTAMGHELVRAQLRKFHVRPGVDLDDTVSSVVLMWYWDHGYVNAHAKISAAADSDGRTRTVLTVEEGPQFHLSAVELVGDAELRERIQPVLLPKVGASTIAPRSPPLSKRWKLD